MPIQLKVVCVLRFTSFFFFFFTISALGDKSTVYILLSTVYTLFGTVYELKNIKNGSTILFTYLKIILLQYFQFSVFSFSNNKFNPNGPKNKNLACSIFSETQKSRARLVCHLKTQCSKTKKICLVYQFCPYCLKNIVQKLML